MAALDWTDHENNAVVADYFAMLACDLSGQSYNKSEHRRALLPALNNRSDGSVEFKHQNISAVLKGMGQPWINGYKPAYNVQGALIDAVDRWLTPHENWVLNQTAQRPLDRAIYDKASLFIGPAPTLQNIPPPEELEQMLAVARKFDVAGRDDRNRALGYAGEELVMASEHANLTAQGRPDLARRIEWVSQTQGDGAGFDIASFFPDGGERLIEVKTTNGYDRTPFHISANELAVAEVRRDTWRLLRLWNFAREPKAFELAPPLTRHVSLTATSFRASFQ